MSQSVRPRRAPNHRQRAFRTVFTAFVQFFLQAGLGGRYHPLPGTMMAGRDPNSYQIQHGPNTHTHPLLLRARTTRRDPSPKYGPRALTPISHSRPKAMTGMPPTRFIIPASSACQLVAHNGQRWEQACPPCSERASSPYAALARSAMHTACGVQVSALHGSHLLAGTLAGQRDVGERRYLGLISGE
jgi:hypothetical protein